jgi:thiol-disulfide isomerase/thioredoxin
MLTRGMGARSTLQRTVATTFAAAFMSGALVTTDAAAQAAPDHPWLGVAMDSDNSGPGVRVGHVIRRSPADTGGIREGDRLLRVGHTSVMRGSDVVRAVAGSAVGEVLEIVLVRGGTQQTVRVTVTQHPSDDDMMRMDLIGAVAPAWRDIEAVSGSFPPSVASVRGRVVLLDFWATWCVPCRFVMPRLGALQARYGAQGLSVLGVSAEEAQDVALFAQRMAPRYAIGVDKHAETTRSYGIMSLPTIVVIDRRGVVRDVSIGYDPMQDTRLEATVRALLAETAPSSSAP